MKTPKFWNKNGFIAMVLTPFSYLYGAVTEGRLKYTKPYKCGAKVICVGNITAGGVGKTPVAMAVAEKYLKEGKKVFFVTRGYKGKLKNVVVDLEKMTAEATGDEARLLAGVAPTIISPDRAWGAKLAVEMGAEVIVMDDGFQNPKLYKDESYVVFDGKVGIGNGKIIPAGPLRETLSDGLKRASKVLIMGEDLTGLKEKCGDVPVYFGRLEPVSNELKGKKVLAFAGIGHPEKFYKTLEDLGAKVIQTKDFADHYAYKTEDIERLKREAAEEGLLVVTTEKDFVKLDKRAREGIFVLKVRAVWNERF